MRITREKRIGHKDAAQIQSGNTITSHSIRQNFSQRGFAIAPILYLLGLIGLGAGILFSGYSQILRSNQDITNDMTAKSDLQAITATMAAASVLSTDTTVLCPPTAGGASAGCSTAVTKLATLATIAGGSNASQLPGSYASTGTTGTPTEVGAFLAGAGVKQLDPYGHFYIVCRWENAVSTPNAGSLMVISAGPDGNLQTKCGDTTAQGDDKIQFLSVGQAIQRSAVWSSTVNGGGNITSVQFGQTGTQLQVDTSGNLTVPGTLGVSGVTTLAAVTTGAITGTSESLSGALTATGGLNAGTGSAFTVSAAGNISTSGTLAVIGSSSLGTVSAGNGSFSGTLSSGGLATLNSASITNNLGVSGNTSLTGTLGVTGASTLTGGINAGSSNQFTVNGSGNVATSGTLSAGASTLSSASVTGAATVGGTLGVTGALSGTSANFSGAVTASSFVGGVTGNATNVTGVVAIANGGTGASDATTARSNLGTNDAGNLTTGTLSASRIASNSIPGADIQTNTVTTTQLNTTGVTAGAYGWGTVGADGRLTFAQNVSSSTFDDGTGEKITATQPSGNGLLTFYTNSVAQMVLDHNGYLGLGTTSPNQRLDLVGNIRIEGAAGTSREIQYTTGSTSKRWVVSTNATAEGGSNAGSDYVIQNYDDTGAALGTIPFKITRSTGNANFGGTVTASTFYGNVVGSVSGGTVGSGVTLGTSVTTANPQIASDATSGFYTPAGSTVAITTGGSEHLRVDASGNVDIGTTSAQSNYILTNAGGLYSSSAAASGVYGTTSSTGDNGVYGGNTAVSGNGAHGVYGTTASAGTASGVYGSNTSASNTGSGVFGTNVSTGTAAGIKGTITGTSNTGYGVYGSNAPATNSGTNYGGYFTDSSTGTGTGVYAAETGASNTGYALHTSNASTTGWGIYASGVSPNYFAGAIGIGATAPKNALDVSGAEVIGASYAGTNTGPTNGLLVQGTVGIGTTSVTGGTALDLGNNTTSSNSSLLLPIGVSSARPTGVNGMIRYNSTTNAVEGFVNGAWGSIGGSGGGSGNLGTSTSATSPSISGDATSGFYTPAGSTVAVATGGNEVMQWNNVASAVDYLSISPAIASGSPIIAAAGSANAGIKLTPVGTGQITVTANALNITSATAGLQLNALNGISYPANDTTTGGSLAIGAAAMPSLPASAAYGNIAIGYQSLSGTLTTNAVQNTALGYQSLASNTAGFDNTAVGFSTLGLVSGNLNTALGNLTLISGASDNTVIGSSIFASGSYTGDQSTAIGSAQFLYNVNGPNLGIGTGSGILISGTNNTVVGYTSMYGFGVIIDSNPSTGNYNSCLGDGCLYLIEGTAANNTSIGYSTLTSLTTASDNTVLGYLGGQVINSGAANILIGSYVAPTNLTTDSNNIIIGNLSDTPVSGTTYFLDIGDLVFGNITGSSSQVGVAIGTSTVTAGTILDLSSATSSGNSAVMLPIGTSAARPTGVNGMVRYNSSNNSVESYANGAWSIISGSGGGSSSLSGLTAATGTNTINNATYLQTWNWSTASSETALTLASSGMTTGSLLTLNNSKTTYTGKSISVSQSGTGTGYGIYSSQGGNSNTGYAVYGINAPATNTGANFGGYFTDNSTGTGTGVYGAELGAGNTGYGVYATNSSANGWGIYSAGTSRNYFAAPVGIGQTAPTTGTSLDLGSNTTAANSTLLLPVGTTGARPVTGVNGMIRYNSTVTPVVEGYINGAWATITSAGAGTSLNSITAAANNQAGIANAAYTIVWNWDTLAGGTALSLNSISTAAASGAQKMLSIGLSGTNVTSAQSTYGLDVSNTHAGTTSTNYAIRGTASSGTAANYGVYGTTASALATSYGGYFTNTGTTNTGKAIYGINNGGTNTGANWGGYFETTSTGAAFGVEGKKSGASGTGAGVYGLTASAGASMGVEGQENGTTNVGYGVYGINNGGTNTGVNWGGYFETTSTGAAFGVQGKESGTTNTGAGVYGLNVSTGAAYGVQGSISGSGNTGYAVYGANSGNTGTNFGVYGTTNSTGTGTGIYGSETGVNNTGYAVYATNSSTTGWGVYSAGTARNYFAGTVGIGTNNPTTGTALDLGSNTTSSNSSVLLPIGTSAARPTGTSGMIRYNSSTNSVEAYATPSWTNIGAGGAGTGYLGVSAANTSPNISGDITSGFYVPGGSTVAVATGGNEVMQWNYVAIAVDYLSVSPAVASGSPIIAVLGSTNAGLNLTPAGTGQVTVTANALNISSASGGLLLNSLTGLTFPSADSTSGASIAIGPSALASLATSAAYGDIAIGYNALTTNNGAAALNNTAVGYDALQFLSTGAHNSAFGYSAMTGIVGTPLTGSNNTGFGYESLFTAQGTAASNTGFGYQSLKANTTGSTSTALGYNSLSSATTSVNTAIGHSALSGATTASGQTVIGANALSTNLSANSHSISVGDGALSGAGSPLTDSIAVGYSALTNVNSDLSNSVAFGANAFYYFDQGGNHYIGTALGNSAGYFVSGNTHCTALGNFALYGITGSKLTGDYNTAVGDSALYTIQGVAANNTAVGYYALKIATTDTTNTAVGYGADQYGVGGSSNTSIGAQSGRPNTNGSTDKTSSTNTFIGYLATSDGNGPYTNMTAIAYNTASGGTIASNAIFLGGSAIASVKAQVTSITTISDRRHKKDIEDLDLGLDFIRKLKPVSYRFKNGDETLRYGFIAQDLENALPPSQQAMAETSENNKGLALIERQNDKDRFYRVAYEELKSPLIKALQEQSVRIKEQQSEINRLKLNMSKGSNPSLLHAAGQETLLPLLGFTLTLILYWGTRRSYKNSASE